MHHHEVDVQLFETQFFAVGVGSAPESPQGELIDLQTNYTLKDKSSEGCFLALHEHLHSGHLSFVLKNVELLYYAWQHIH